MDGLGGDGEAVGLGGVGLAPQGAALAVRVVGADVEGLALVADPAAVRALRHL